jgi:hypothetical protein
LHFFRPLELLQTRVQTVLCEQLIVRAALDDAALVEHEDDIGIPDRCHPMRVHERRFAGEQAVIVSGPPPRREEESATLWKDADPDPDIPILTEAQAEYAKLQ